MNIIELAKKACFENTYLCKEPHGRTLLFLERFAALVAANEREACAKVCEWLIGWNETERKAVEICAAAIRARNEK